MASHQSSAFMMCFTFCLLSVLSIAPTSCMAATKYYDFEISFVNYTRNCHTKPILAVNGMYPGPTIYVSEGDRVIVKVKNSGNTNVSIHWHGIRQLRSSWQDGTGYITECPTKPGDYDIYDFVVSQQRGTTFWHAHVGWVRATVYGAFITLPTDGSYPFPQPYDEIPILLGEWWNQDVEVVEQTALASGSIFQTADAVTMNGWPGIQYNCSAAEGVTRIDVEPGKTYLLRLINAGLNTDMFFGIANHTLTVVEADSNYVKPFTVDRGVVVAPGQTLNVLVTANQPPAATYYMEGRSHNTLLLTDFSPSNIPPVGVPFVLQDVPPIPTTGLFQYKEAPVMGSEYTFFPSNLPLTNDTNYSAYFFNGLKNLYPGMLPWSDSIRHLFYTVGTGLEHCPNCAPGQRGYRVAGQVNNISFVSPTTAILIAYYYKIPGVYKANFPDFPPKFYDFAAAPSPPNPDEVVQKATRLSLVEYGTVLEIVLQNVNNFAFESHPFHLHGNFFHILGQGFGDYNATTDPGTLNYYDPPMRFTISVPTRGWAVIRFKADNPGAWLFHCHLDKHLSWGMETVFIVKDGETSDQKLLPPPTTLNKC
ncbi:unnamed protein product [Calypogeia fissa]